MKLDLPEDTTLSTFGDQGTVMLRSEWAPPGAGRTFAAGSLLAMPPPSAWIICERRAPIEARQL